MVKYVSVYALEGLLSDVSLSLGDQFARWTSKCCDCRPPHASNQFARIIDDVFKSTVHRAVNRSGVRRYSIPLFFGTDYDVRLEVKSFKLPHSNQRSDRNIAYLKLHLRRAAAEVRGRHRR